MQIENASTFGNLFSFPIRFVHWLGVIFADEKLVAQSENEKLSNYESRTNLKPHEKRGKSSRLC
jgi:hypothetical protein